MSKRRADDNFQIHVDEDCLSPAMEETKQLDETTISTDDMAQPQVDETSASSNIDEVADSAKDDESQIPSEPENSTISQVDQPPAETESTEEAASVEPTTSDLAENLTQENDIGVPESQSTGEVETSLPDTVDDSNHDTPVEQEQELEPVEQVAEATRGDEVDASEVDDTTTETESQNEEGSSLLDTCSLDRHPSVRTEALIQAAARAVLSMRQNDQGQEEQQPLHEETEDSVLSSAPDDTEDPDETVHMDHEALPSRPESSASLNIASPTEHSSVGADTNSYRGTEDDTFSERSLRSSTYSDDGHYDDDKFEQMTEKGDQSPYVRSRVASGVSMSGDSAISDFSRLSRYEKDDFVPTSRNNRPAFRSPSSVRAIQMSSPTPSIYSNPGRSAKRPNAFPTISRLGSPSVSGRHSPKGRSTPSRFKPQEAPLVLLHVTLLPLRWGYGEMMNHFEAKKLAPLAFNGEGIKNLRGAWRQLQDRLGDTVLERGILLPHPQNDYEILEERLLEALELPLRRRARILECGHFLGPSNQMAIPDDMEEDSDDASDAGESDAGAKNEVKRHWCKTCKGDIKYEELGSERVFRIKVYASNGLMSAGAWEACWKEMERVDIEVEPIIDSGVQADLAKLTAVFDQEQLQQQEAEQNQLAEEERKLQQEVEQRLSLEDERQQLEAQRQQFEEEQRRTLEEAEKKLEAERRKIEEEQRQLLEEERRQQFEEERQLLDAQRQQFEEQRLELEQQRKLVEEEQRLHLEEARRQELEEEHRLLDEQRQELELARQQFEEERRQQLEEEEIRRLQREVEEHKQASVTRSASRASYVEDELASPSPRPISTDIDGRRRDSARMREIYGDQSRASSDGLANSSPAIHIHVDSASRQREEEPNTQQLATIPTPSQESRTVLHEARHPDSYIPPPSPPSPSEQAYQRREDRRRSLDTASLPELLGETIRVMLQDPKNVAIAVLVVLIAMLFGLARREERGVDIYKPQQHYQNHQLGSREPIGQVVVNTPSQLVETIYKTVTAETQPQKAPASRDVEVVYHTVTQYANQQPTHVVETVYSTVTHAVVDSPAGTAVPEVASESSPTGSNPSIASLLPRFDSPSVEGTAAAPSSFRLVALGLDPFSCAASAFCDTETEMGLNSDEDLYQTIALPETEQQDMLTTDDHTVSSFTPQCTGTLTQTHTQQGIITETIGETAEISSVDLEDVVVAPVKFHEGTVKADSAILAEWSVKDGQEHGLCSSTCMKSQGMIVPELLLAEATCSIGK